MASSSSDDGSPPRTPPSKLPGSYEQWRFPCKPGLEIADSYHPGGYHPVHIGDVFHRRYKAISKLGFGAFSTIWLVQNQDSQGFFALKIKMAKDSIKDRELVILNRLAESKIEIGRENILLLRDHFYHQGVNGNHLCLVFDVMQCDLNKYLEVYAGMTTSIVLTKFPKLMAKRMLKDILRGLSFLHQSGIVHGDLQPGNFLASTRNLSALKSGALEVDVKDVTVELKRRDGKLDRWSPKYLTRSRLCSGSGPTDAFPIKISDFGGAHFASELYTNEESITPVGLRSPELVLNPRLNTTSNDIWSFGCLLYELIVGEQLFPAADGDDEEDIQDETLLYINNMLRPLPHDIHKIWPRSEEYFRFESGKYHELYPASYPNMDAIIRRAFLKDNRLGEEEAETLISLMHKILDFDPLKRPSALKILESSFWDMDV